MENDFHQWLFENLSASGRAKVGIGDDAAVLDWVKDHECVVTSDMLAEGVHFRLDEVGPERVGRKSLAVNLSDLAAMGSRPVAAVVSLMIPQSADTALPRVILQGMQSLADTFNMAIVGGDTNTWPGELVISVTALGVLDGNAPFRRDGAKAGDILLVTGPLGGSLLGHHLDFVPRVQKALDLQTGVSNGTVAINAAMDISDGLAMDSSRMAARSGCGIELDATKIPVSAAARKMSDDSSGKTPLQHALGDGEDFELLLAMSPKDAAKAAAEFGLFEVGQCVDNDGLWLLEESGKRVALQPTGYQH